MIAKDLAKAKSNTGKIIANSTGYLQLTQVVMVIFAIGLFALMAVAIY
jgi:ABC-type nitrate/sulfonate/bicarbonate transport system permease component